MIHDTPGAPYRTSRTLLFKADPNGALAEFLLIVDLHGDAALDNSTIFEQEVYYTAKVDAADRYKGWAGPFHADHPEVAELLNHKIDLSAAFKNRELAANAVAFIQDMAYCHGRKHFYGDASYVIDWRSISQVLRQMKDPDLKQDYPSGGISLDEKQIYIWAPVHVPAGDTLGNFDGALSTGLDLNSGRVDMLWISLN